MTLRSAVVLAGLALGLMSGMAKADTLRFEFNGSSASVGAFTFEFQVNSQPIPARYLQNQSFVLNDVKISEKDSVTGGSTSDLDIIFLSRLAAGGFTIYDPSNDDGIRLLGQAVFDGPTATPTFKVGTFDLTGFQVAGGNLVPNTDIVGTLNVSAVPLPASAPMFGAALFGLAGLGYVAKRKKAAAEA